MNQKIFSKLVYDYLNQNFPEFILNIKYYNDDSFEVTMRSPSNVFSMWVSTINCEITFGLEDPDNITDIHTHISCYELEDIDNCLSILSGYINDIKNEKTILYRKNNGQYDWIKCSRFLKNKNGERFYWN